MTQNEKMHASIVILVDLCLINFLLRHLFDTIKGLHVYFFKNDGLKIIHR
jgi:hypothetical protein